MIGFVLATALACVQKSISLSIPDSTTTSIPPPPPIDHHSVSGTFNMNSLKAKRPCLDATFINLQALLGTLEARARTRRVVCAITTFRVWQITANLVRAGWWDEKTTFWKVLKGWRCGLSRWFVHSVVVQYSHLSCNLHALHISPH